VLTRTAYIGRHRFDTEFWKMRERKPGAAVEEMAVPPIINPPEFEAVQMHWIHCTLIGSLAADGIERG